MSIIRRGAAAGQQSPLAWPPVGFAV